MRSSGKFYSEYNPLLSFILRDGIEEINARTGVKIKALPGAYSFLLNLNDEMLPVTGTRKLFPRSAAAEVAWFLEGSQDVGFIKKYAPIWDKFVEADGKTIEAAYGYRWKSHFGRDQLTEAIDALKKDSTNRRVYLSAWDPGSDGLMSTGQKNVPCPTSFSLNIVNGELHCAYFLRSSDVFVGLPYDVMNQSLLMQAIAKELNVKLGTLHVTLAHAHLYEMHWDMARECFNSYMHPHSTENPFIPTLLKMPDLSISDIKKDLDGYVKLVADLSKKAVWSSFNPKPFVVE